MMLLIILFRDVCKIRWNNVYQMHFKIIIMINVFGITVWGLPTWHTGEEPTCQCSRHKRCRFHPWVREIPWGREWQPTPEFLPGEFHGQRSLGVFSPWGHKESDTTEQLSLSQNAKASVTLASNLWDNFRRYNQLQSEKYLLIKKSTLIRIYGIVR